jgi:hypothetical protein
VVQEYPRTSRQTFEAAADDFVDFIALHELVHEGSTRREQGRPEHSFRAAK